jgi:hypothetical protein
MSEEIEQRGLEISWVFFIMRKLVLESISRFIERIDLIRPERFLVKGVKPYDKTNKKAKKK